MHEEKDSVEQTIDSGPVRNLRIWPAVLLLTCLWGLWIGAGRFEEISIAVMLARFLGPLVCAGLIVAWWLFLSRATWKERILGVLGLVAIMVVSAYSADKTIRGFLAIIYSVPWGITGFAVALIGLSRMRSTRRTWIALVVSLAFFGYWDLIRIDEFRGNFATSRSWRWEPTAEDRFLQELAERPRDADPSAAEAEWPVDPEWPAFRGPQRDGVQPGVVLDEDWQVRPPAEVWRTRVGPGWSSFSVAGKRLFTQEQRGDEEVVVCYDADRGTEIWVHAYASRFWESIGGAGPRATPTLSDGDLYALGAAGMLHRLDAATGAPVWQRDIREDAGRQPPEWGFASSPLIIDGVVIVHAGGSGDKGLLAYDAEQGDLRWSAPAGDHSYSSPQYAEIRGTACVLMLTNKGLTIVDPAEGTPLGEHDWEFEGYRVVQPLVVDDASVLLGTAMGTGTRRVELREEGERFTVETTWTSRRMNPYYNDYVAHRKHLYGFDNNIFACVSLDTGERAWKGGRYGNGQVLLLPDGDQLLVISEDGELVLLRAAPDGLDELAKHRVLDGRTWNHPVLVGNRLYVRNAEQAACFELPLKPTVPARATDEI